MTTALLGRPRGSFRNRYGPWALVTGASDGIGSAMARELAALGLNVVLVARRRGHLEVVAREIESNHPVSTKVIAIDLAQSGSGASVLTEMEGLDFGLLAVCAGFGTSGWALDIPVADELSMVDVNCRAAFEMTRLYANRFAARGRGGIILMSSIVAF